MSGVEGGGDHQELKKDATVSSQLWQRAALTGTSSPNASNQPNNIASGQGMALEDSCFHFQPICIKASWLSMSQPPFQYFLKIAGGTVRKIYGKHTAAGCWVQRTIPILVPPFPSLKSIIVSHTSTIGKIPLVLWPEHRCAAGIIL